MQSPYTVICMALRLEYSATSHRRSEETSSSTWLVVGQGQALCRLLPIIPLCSIERRQQSFVFHCLEMLNALGLPVLLLCCFCFQHLVPFILQRVSTFNLSSSLYLIEQPLLCLFFRSLLLCFFCILFSFLMCSLAMSSVC